MRELAIRACLMPSERMIVTSVKAVHSVILMPTENAVSVSLHVRLIAPMDVSAVLDRQRALLVVV